MHKKNNLNASSERKYIQSQKQRVQTIPAIIVNRHISNYFALPRTGPKNPFAYIEPVYLSFYFENNKNPPVYIEPVYLLH